MSKKLIVTALPADLSKYSPKKTGTCKGQTVYDASSLTDLIEAIVQKQTTEWHLFFPDGIYQFKKSIDIPPDAEGLVIEGQKIGRQHGLGGACFEFLEDMSFKVNGNDTITFDACSENLQAFDNRTRNIVTAFDTTNPADASGCINVRAKHVTISNLTITQTQPRDLETARIFHPAIWARKQDNNVAASEYCTIKNIHFVDVFYGIRIDSGNAMLKYITGHPTFRGVHLNRGGSSDPSHISHVHFRRTNDKKHGELCYFAGSAFYFTGCEHAMISNAFAIGYEVGFHFKKGLNTKIHISNADLDTCHIPLLVEQEAHGSAQIVNMTAKCAQEKVRAPYDNRPSTGIYIKTEKGFEFQAANVILSEMFDTGIYVSGKSTLALLQNIIVTEFGKDPRPSGGHCRTGIFADDNAQIILGTHAIYFSRKDDTERFAFAYSVGSKIYLYGNEAKDGLKIENGGTKKTFLATHSHEKGEQTAKASNNSDEPFISPRASM